LVASNIKYSIRSSLSSFFKRKLLAQGWVAQSSICFVCAKEFRKEGILFLSTRFSQSGVENRICNNRVVSLVPPLNHYAQKIPYLGSCGSMKIRPRARI
jgi:hypothetical protein